MIIGVPKEIKTHEYRVGMTAGSVGEAVKNGHRVLVQRTAGDGIGITDEMYVKAGAELRDSAEEIFNTADMIVKVKEPQPQECKMLRKGQILFTYLHLAPDPVQTQLLQESGCIAIAYETVTSMQGGLPLLAPMSEVAGRMAVQAGAHALEKAQGGRGLLLGGVPGVAPADVVVLGGGVVGAQALRIAIGTEANVVVLDKSIARLKELDNQFKGKLNTIFATTEAVEYHIRHADLVVGAVLVPGGAAPKLVRKDMLKTMRPGAVIVDVAIDQGGCTETSRPTTHADPTYIVDGVVHYCVANMPGAVPRTATFALNNATLPFILALANKGYQQALMDDVHLLNGLNICCGMITHPEVAKAFSKDYVEPKSLLAA